MTTVPIVFEGKHLILNVDTGALGSARVELLDEQNRVIPGFGQNDCTSINGNYVEHLVNWKEKDDLSALAGKVIRLRFTMRSTKLYAFQFVGE